MKIILGLILILISLPSFTAEREGGGGIGVQCGESVKTLDLYEAENIYGWKVSRVPSSFRELLKSKHWQYSKYLSQEQFPIKENSRGYELIKEEVLDKLVDIPWWKTLPLSGDAKRPVLPSSCRFVQIIYYSDISGQVLRDRLLWNKLSLEDQVALILHEYMYLHLRDSGELNSDRVRYHIASLFSDRLKERVFAPIFESGTYYDYYYQCEIYHSSTSSSSEFLLSADYSGNLQFIFSKNEGLYTMERFMGINRDWDFEDIHNHIGEVLDIDLRGVITNSQQIRMAFAPMRNRQRTLDLSFIDVEGKEIGFGGCTRMSFIQEAL
jgi:hypothetical protein